MTAKPITEIQAFEQLQRGLQSNNERTLQIVVNNPGTVGGTPCVAVVNLAHGFDWDNHKVLLYPEQPLTTLTPEQVADISASVRKGQSWHAYQSYKKQQEKIDALTREVEQLRAQLAETKQ